MAFYGRYKEYESQNVVSTWDVINIYFLFVLHVTPSRYHCIENQESMNKVFATYTAKFIE